MKLLKKTALAGAVAVVGLLSQVNLAQATLYTTTKSVVVQRNGYRVAIPPNVQFDFTSDEATYLLNVGVIRTPNGETTFSTPTSGVSAGGGGSSGTVSTTPQITAYAANTAYTSGQLVIYNNTLYQNTASYTSGSSFDATKWQAIGASGGGGSSTQITTYANTTAYASGALVLYNNALYQAITGFTSASSFNSANWNLIGAPAANVLATMLNRTVITPTTTTVATTVTTIYPAGTFAHIDIQGTVEGVEVDCTSDNTTPALGGANSVKHLLQHLRWPNFQGQIGAGPVKCIASASTTIIPYAD